MSDQKQLDLIFVDLPLEQSVRKRSYDVEHSVFVPGDLRSCGRAALRQYSI